MFDYLNVSEKIREKVKENLVSIGYKFCDIFKYSNHPEDSYLYLVVGKGGYLNGYAVWLYNSDLDSLNSGTYDLNLKELFQNVGERLRDINL